MFQGIRHDTNEICMVNNNKLSVLVGGCLCTRFSCSGKCPSAFTRTMPFTNVYSK